MRSPALTVFAATLAMTSANAQDGAWGDSSAARYNTPIGYSSQAAFNGSAKPPKIANKFRRKSKKSHAADVCAFELDGARPGLDSRPDLYEGPGLPRPSCAGVQTMPSLDAHNDDISLTVVTTGAWNTVIVESRREKTPNQTGALNGGLNLE